MLDWIIAPIIRRVDRFLRRRQGIFEFETAPLCIMRASIRRFDEPHRWPDGTVVEAGSPVGELHFWNERLRGFSIAESGGKLRDRFSFSMRAVYQMLLEDPRVEGVAGFFADSWVPAEHNSRALRRTIRRWGFLVDFENDRCEFWDELYVRLLTRTFNPGTPRTTLRRVRIWVSREELLRRYAELGPVTKRQRKTAANIPRDDAERLAAGG